MPDPHEVYTREFVASEPKIRAFASACGLSLAEVDDLVQDAAVVLWRRFGDYDRTIPFLSWALGVARNLIRSGYRTRTRRGTMLSPQTIDSLADSCTSMDESLDRARHALETCVEKLPKDSQSVLRMRYFEELSLSQIGERLGRRLSAVNMALRRMRFALVRCVRRELEA